ncbi:hypothetical protein [uncultured Amphritea sp.]|uniref:hypothetical protein n=1 Tax=uncultured Amphritea sp. TaxID=981605 RepID=UPI0026382BB0|nr:hypothetical protein [uncultured Amphritea sp.]
MNDRIEGLGFQRNISRRFAMPCFTGEKQRETEHLLQLMLGQAQLLADTFKEKMMSGVSLAEFVAVINEIRANSFEYSFVTNQISEPLGVAGSIMSWKSEVNSLLLVVDVGAGTSDFSLFRIKYNPDTGESVSREISGSTRAITEAGNHLDKLLTEYILHKGAVTYDDPLYLNIRGALSLEIRHYKEALFRDHSLYVTLFGGETVVEVELEEFLQLESVQSFGNALRSCMLEILETIDPTWLRTAPFGGMGVALTGGGAELPMVQDLARDTLQVQGIELRLKQTASFPAWLEEEHHHLKDDYSRVAVSLGGAREQYIMSSGTSYTTGERYATVTLDGYYTKGN